MVKTSNICKKPGSDNLGFLLLINILFMLMCFSRHCDGFFKRIAFIQSSMDSSLVDIVVFRPFFECLGFPVTGNPFSLVIVSSIVGLYFRCSPAAVVWCVWAVVIDSVNGEIVAVSVGHGPISECLEALAPLGADRDAAASISKVGIVIFV